MLGAPLFAEISISANLRSGAFWVLCELAGSETGVPGALSTAPLDNEHENTTIVHYCTNVGLWVSWTAVKQSEFFCMSRISIDVTDEEHQRLKAMAALQGKSIKEYVIERTLGVNADAGEANALKELEALLDRRIRSAQNGAAGKRIVGKIFKNAHRERKGK
jgi:hypothetical protein